MCCPSQFPHKVLRIKQCTNLMCSTTVASTHTSGILETICMYDVIFCPVTSMLSVEYTYVCTCIDSYVNILYHMRVYSCFNTCQQGTLFLRSKQLRYSYIPYSWIIIHMNARNKFNTYSYTSKPKTSVCMYHASWMKKLQLRS